LYAFGQTSHPVLISPKDNALNLWMGDVGGRGLSDEVTPKGRKEGREKTFKKFIIELTRFCLQ
jgi:hypothetical protein